MSYFKSTSRLLSSLAKFDGVGVRALSTGRTMAQSKFEYVRGFETEDRLLPNCWIVVRIDGKGFHKFADKHEFTKPNDEKALALMARCARRIFNDYNEVVVAYGESDEFSFVFKKDTELYNRRASKIMTNVVSLFSSSYVLYWPEFFPERKLLYPPTFDARTVLYPSDKNLRDYLSWRQADCHINNLYNTVFWALVLKGGLSNSEAQARLSGTVSGEKNEILFSEFNTNYNNEPELFRKGTVIWKKSSEVGSKKSKKASSEVAEANCDIIGDAFWIENNHLLS